MALIQLSQHFMLHEFTDSDHAARLHINNDPPPLIVEQLKRISTLMEQVRTHLNVPIQILSGYRCSALNKLVGSKPTSAHVQGLACDFKAPGYGDPVAVCKSIQASDLQFDQLILEFYNPATGGGWTHIGIGSKMRRQILTINPTGTFTGILP